MVHAHAVKISRFHHKIEDPVSSLIVKVENSYLEKENANNALHIKFHLKTSYPVLLLFVKMIRTLLERMVNVMHTMRPWNKDITSSKMKLTIAQTLY
jgi:hypothetical protein